jgi:hypothetical protein
MKYRVPHKIFIVEIDVSENIFQIAVGELEKDFLE